MKTAFLKLFVILIICIVLSSAYKPHKHARKARDIREFKKIIDKRDEYQDSCCCKNESWKKKSQDNEDKMSRYYYETSTDDDDDQKQKPSKHMKPETKFKANKNSDPDKHVSKKTFKKVKDIEEDATSVYSAETEKDFDPKIKDSHAAYPKNSSISSTIICLQKCVETLTKWKF